MPEAFGLALSQEGLVWLIAASFTAGLVRGFTGFGSGLVLLPVVAIYLSPVAAITAMTIADFFGPIPILRKALRSVHLPDLGRLCFAMMVGLPVGVAVLLVLDPDLFRFAVSGVAAIMLVLLVSGARYSGTLTPPLIYATGGLAGLLGGVAGLPGPPIILLYLASQLPAIVVRGTTMAFLFVYDMVLFGVYAINGALLFSAIWLGLVLAIPNVLGNILGAALFRADYERFYRAAAYTIIASSALSGLPVWD